MTKIKIIAIALCLLAMALSDIGFAQALSTKHPRVIDLEKNLSREGLELLKGRFPDKPFLMTVKIDALMRERPTGRDSGERLPYYDLSDEEVVDEWDDPSISNSALMNRVRSIYANISIPADLTDDEVAELKSTLVNNLGLIEARDKVEVVKRNWGSLDRSQNLNWKWVGTGAAAWALLMVGLFGIFWYSTSKIGKVFKETQAVSNKANISSQPMPAPALTENSERKSRHSGSGDLRFSDPIKNRESLASAIRLIESHSGFPNLQDMMTLHKYAEENPGELGALMSEIPFELRVRIFAGSYGPEWLQAMTEPGEVSFSCVEVLNRCLRHQRNDVDTDWQTLLISVWRLNEKRKDFFRGLNQNESFAILNSLPKSMALEIAREFFPGAWGLLLDPQFQATALGQDQIKQLIQRAIAIEPYRNIKSLDKYKNEKELLGFLKISDPSTEKEIYKAAGEQSAIWSIRAPFYQIFELTAEQYEKIVPAFQIEEWALAMFNISRTERKQIEKVFTEKQRFRYFEILKAYDNQIPNRFKVGEARERIASRCRLILEQAAKADLIEKNEKAEPPEQAVA
jgi:hypothetical protein